MKISIVTPSFNQGSYLEETLLSIINQEYPEKELIVIDGGSSDNSIEIIKKYSNSITYWISERDKGQSEAINKGFSKATGDIITWINSDDLLLPGTLKKIASIYSNAPEDTGVVHGGTVIFENKEEKQHVYTYGKPSIEKYLSGMAFSQPSAFIKRSYLEKVGYLREELHYGMDYDLFARLACVSHFKFEPILFSKYRLHNESKSVAHHEKFRKDWDKIFISICSHLGWNDIIEEAQCFLPEKNIAIMQYQFIADQKIIQAVNKKKVLFYFLSDLLLHFYWYDERDKARLILSKMKDEFPRIWFKEDIRIRSVIRKLQIPEFLLLSLKSVKKIIK